MKAHYPVTLLLICGQGTLQGNYPGYQLPLLVCANKDGADAGTVIQPALPLLVVID
jgi:hypothetical protein